MKLFNNNSSAPLRLFPTLPFFFLFVLHFFLTRLIRVARLRLTLCAPEIIK